MQRHDVASTLHKRHVHAGLDHLPLDSVVPYYYLFIYLFIFYYFFFYIPEFPVHNCFVVQYIYYPNTNIEDNQNSKPAVVFKLSFTIFIQHRVHISRTWKYFSLVCAVTFREKWSLDIPILCDIHLTWGVKGWMLGGVIFVTLFLKI